MIHLDTSFLVDLLRERRRKESGAATQALKALENEEMAISIFVASELFAGAEISQNRRREREIVREICASLHMSLPVEGFAPAYGRLLAELRRKGTAVDTMDLLIATAALQDRAPLLIRNVRHFDPIPGLEVIEY